jgi:hypothetical protein
MEQEENGLAIDLGLTEEQKKRVEKVEKEEGAGQAIMKVLEEAGVPEISEEEIDEETLKLVRELKEKAEK